MSKRRFPLLEYEIKGEGVHCEVDIYCANNKIGTFTNTGSKYSETAAESLAEFIKEKLFGDSLDNESMYEDEEDD